MPEEKIKEEKKKFSEPKVDIIKQKGHNFLWIDDYLWMWDIPIERKIQEGIANKAYGKIIVAGYGFGIVQEYLTKNPKVKFVLTIEKSKEVMSKVKEVYGKIYGEVKIGNFYDYPENEKFDCVVGDIWKEIVPESLEEYKKFKNKAKKLIKENGKILGWGGEFFEYLLNKEKTK